MRVLYAEQGNKNAYKSLIAAEYCGVKVKHVEEYEMSDKTHLFLNDHVFVGRNRVGKVPVLETLEGPIVESNAMARYVAKVKDGSTLCGSSAFEFVQIEQWMAFATTEIDGVLTRWFYPRIGVDPYNPLAEPLVIDCMTNALHILNTHLDRGDSYLVGNRITLADIVMTCDLYWGFTRIMTKSFTSDFPNVEQYFWNLVCQQQFKKILGEIKQVESLPQMERRSKRKLYLRSDVIEAVKKKRENKKREVHKKIDEQKIGGTEGDV
ncbi:hypothetical protein LUZ60_008238 [Juncus effusus]|nr:hypothetical protein LUZ60_008238 [Juncus effusus]